MMEDVGKTATEGDASPGTPHGGPGCGNRNTIMAVQGLFNLDGHSACKFRERAVDNACGILNKML